MIDKYILFKAKDFVVSDKITIHHPTLNEIFEFGESRYFSMVSSLSATPFDFKVQLDDMKIDYEKMSDYELFIIMFKTLSHEDTSILFGELDFKKFKVSTNISNDEIVLYNYEDDIVIDQSIYLSMVEFIRDINFFTRTNFKAGNAHTKEYLIERERKKMKRQRNTAYQSILIDLISSMINCEQFKYRYDDVWGLPIYVFNDSVRRIQKIKNYENIMLGVYTGNINAKNISQESLSWLGSLE